MQRPRMLPALLPLALLVTTATVGHGQPGADEEIDRGTRTGFQQSTHDDIADWSREFGDFLAAHAAQLANYDSEVGIELYEKFFVNAEDMAWVVENSVPEEDREVDAVIDGEGMLDLADSAVDEVMTCMEEVRDAGYDLSTVRYETFGYNPTDPDRDWASYEVALLFSCRTDRVREFFTLWVECYEVAGTLKFMSPDYDAPEPF